jgi:hypothetical protein
VRAHGEQAPQPARADDHCYFVGVGEIVDRNGHRAGRRNSQASDDPRRAVRSHQADAFVRGDPRLQQTQGH